MPTAKQQQLTSKVSIGKPPPVENEPIDSVSALLERTNTLLGIAATGPKEAPKQPQGPTDLVALFGQAFLEAVDPYNKTRKIFLARSAIIRVEESGDPLVYQVQDTLGRVYHIPKRTLASS